MYIKMDINVVASILNIEMETGCSEMSPLGRLKVVFKGLLGNFNF